MRTGPDDGTDILVSSASAPMANLDRRVGRRHAVVLLIGKVHHADRESICLVHDISSFGLMARFTILPVIGEVLDIEVRAMPALRSVVRWVDGFFAGVEFVTPHRIDPVFTARGTNGRVARSPRFAIGADVRFKIGADWHDAHLVDISSGGAKLASVFPVRAGQTGQIVMPGPDITIFATICWTRGNRFGVRFVAPLSITTLSLILAHIPDCQVPIPPPGDLATTTGD